MPAFAHADEYTPFIIPPCTMYTVAGVGPVCGFADIEDWKRILRADAELVTAREQLKNHEAREANLIMQVRFLHDQVDLYAEQQKSLLAQTVKLTDDLIALDKKYQEERVKPRWGGIVAWTAAAVSTSLLVGVLVHAAVN